MLTITKTSTYKITIYKTHIYKISYCYTIPLSSADVPSCHECGTKLLYRGGGLLILEGYLRVGAVIGDDITGCGGSHSSSSTNSRFSPIAGTCGMESDGVSTVTEFPVLESVMSNRISVGHGFKRSKWTTLRCFLA